LRFFIFLIRLITQFLTGPAGFERPGIHFLTAAADPFHMRLTALSLFVLLQDSASLQF
jgi:hypothetical protein